MTDITGWVWFVSGNTWKRCVSFQKNPITGRASVETYDNYLYDGLLWRRLGADAILCEEG